MTNKKIPKKSKWTKEDEEIIEFFVGLIPIMQEVKRDLESKNLLGKEFLQHDYSKVNKKSNRSNL